MRLATLITNIGMVVAGIYLFSLPDQFAKIGGVLIIIGTIVFWIERHNK